MDITDTGKLLALCAVFDQRSIGEADILGWQQVIPSLLTYEDCSQAVVAHYRNSPDRIMPSQVIRRAWDARSRRNGTALMELD